MDISPEIEHQQNLLKIYRRNLAHSLQQREALRDTYIPHQIFNDIYSAREQIRKSKAILRELGIVVEDHPNDESSATDEIIRNPSLSSHERRNRQRLLRKVYDFWIKGLLEDSLYDTTLIELGLQYKPDAVQYPWDMVVQTEHSARKLSPKTRIIQVFDELGGELLILGTPGSGKTTMLLELTQELIKRAEQDEAYPIPIVFNLSSWSEKRRPVIEWLIEELNTKYGVPKRIGRSWIDTDTVIPLLDGLDEVKQEQRVACIEAINIFRQEHGLVDIVVCSRIADYEMLSVKLILQGAVLIEPLTILQIGTFLELAGDKLAVLRMAVAKDAELRELAQTPLILNMMALVYQSADYDTLPTTGGLEERRKQLLAAYVEKMFARRAVEKRYTKEQTLQWLKWLAWSMTKHSQSIFFIERMQPSWLVNRNQQLIYLVATSLTAGTGFGLPLTGATIGFGVAIGTYKPLFWILAFLLDALLMAVMITPSVLTQNMSLGSWFLLLTIPLWWSIIGIYIYQSMRNSFIGSNHIRVLERLGWSSSGAKISTLWGFAGFPILIVISFGVLGLPFGLLTGIFIGIFIGLINGFRNTSVEQYIHFKSRVWQAVQKGTFIGGLIGLGGGTALGVGGGLGLRLNFGYAFWISILTGVIASITAWYIGKSMYQRRIRNQKRSIIRNYQYRGKAMTGIKKKSQYEPYTPVFRSQWSWSQALYGVVAGLSGSISFWIIGIGSAGFLLMFVFFLVSFFPSQTEILLFPSSIYESQMVSTGMLSLYAIGCLGGGLTGWAVGAVRFKEVETTDVPNQGIIRSTRYAITILVISMIISSISATIMFMILSSLLPIALNNNSISPDVAKWYQNYNSNYLFRFQTLFQGGIVSGLPFALGFGGFAFLQHFVLRFTLWFQGVVPLNYARFLNYANERIFLRRIGGGYIFIHRVLQNHFADLYEKDHPTRS